MKLNCKLIYEAKSGRKSIQSSVGEGQRNHTYDTKYVEQEPNGDKAMAEWCLLVTVD